MTSELTRPRGRPRTRTVSDEEAFLLEDVPATSAQVRGTGDTAGTITIHNAPGRVLMWKPGADGLFTPRVVSEKGRAELVKNGWKHRCPDCNTNHETSQYPPEDPNSCPGREPLAWTSCPVCRKRHFDNMQWDNAIANPDASDAEAMIVDEVAKSTPRDRVMLIRNLHMWTRHPRQSQMMGIPQLPVALREIVDGMRTVT